MNLGLKFMNFWAFWGRGVNFWDKFAEFGCFSSLRGGKVAEAIHYATKSRFLGTNLHFKNARGALWIASTATQSRNDGLLCHSERNEVKRRIHELKAILRLWIFRYAQNDKMVANSVNFNANSAQNSQKFTKFAPKIHKIHANSAPKTHCVRGGLLRLLRSLAMTDFGVNFCVNLTQKFTKNYQIHAPKVAQIQPKKRSKKALNDKI